MKQFVKKKLDKLEESFTLGSDSGESDDENSAEIQVESDNKERWEKTGVEEEKLFKKVLK